MYRLNHRFQKIKNRRLFPVTYLYSLFWRSPSGVFNYLGTILIVEVSIGCQNARPLTSRRDWCLLSGLDVWLVVWARPLIGYRKPRGWEAGIRRGEWWCGSWRELEESRSTVARNPCPGQGNSSLWRKRSLGPFFGAKAPLYLLADISFLFPWIGARLALLRLSSDQASLSPVGRARSLPERGFLLSSGSLAGSAALTDHQSLEDLNWLREEVWERKYREENMSSLYWSRGLLVRVPALTLIGRGRMVLFSFIQCLGEATPFREACCHSWGEGWIDF